MLIQARDVIASILGGLAIIGVQVLWHLANRQLRHWRLKKVFGKTINDDDGVKIVYAELELNPEIADLAGPSIYRYVKPTGKNGLQEQAQFSILRPVSSSEVRAIDYLSNLVSTKSQGTQRIVPDSDYQADWPSTISVGGPLSNHTTRFILGLRTNTIVEMNSNAIYAKGGAPLAVHGGPYDYGIIARFTQKDSGDRVLIACAGIGEYGTSGASWYLANKWPSLLRKPGHSRISNLIGRGGDFVAVIRVDGAQDSSAQLEFLFTSNEAALETAQSLGLTVPSATDTSTVISSGSTMTMVTRFSDPVSDNSASVE